MSSEAVTVSMYSPGTWQENATNHLDQPELATVHALLAIAAAIEQLAKAVEGMESN